MIYFIHKEMALHRIKLSWVIGILSTCLFAFLLMVRLDLFGGKKVDRQANPASPSLKQADRDLWMNIFQKDRKIGYVHRQFSKTEKGYRSQESVFMRVNTLGMVQDIRFRTIADLLIDFTLSTFNFDLQSSLFRFKARGGVTGNILTIFAGPAGFERKTEVLIEKGIYLPSSLLETVILEKMKQGESRTFEVFDPTVAAMRPAVVMILGEEPLSIHGHQEMALKASVHFMGASQFAWIGKDGIILREEGLLGIHLDRTSKEEAFRNISAGGEDLTEATSIVSNKILSHPEQLKELKVKVSGIREKEIFIGDGRQSFQDGILTIRKEDVPASNFRNKTEKIIPALKRYLEPTPFIQSDHPEIRAKVREIVSSGDSDWVKANKLAVWVNQHIQKRPVLSVPNALETLKNRVGDCNEHAVLLAALLKASHIPAQVEAGLVYQNGRFYYHAWNALYLGRWITADSVMGQLPADVTHLCFVRGTEDQIDLMGVIGRVRLEILSTF